MKIEKRGKTWVLVGPGKGCRPATSVEVSLWADKMRLDWLVRRKRRWIDGNGSLGSTTHIKRRAIDAAIRAEAKGWRKP